MGKCVYCGKLGNNKEKVSLHRFPRDETSSKRWIEILGLEGWLPTKTSLLCSDHFTDDCFATHNGRTKKILIPGKVPIRSTKKVKCVPQESKNVSIELANDVEYAFTRAITESVPETLVEIECQDGSSNVNEKHHAEDASALSIIESVPELLIEVECEDVSSNATDKLSEELGSSDIGGPRKKARNDNVADTEHEKILHDHHYEKSTRTLNKELTRYRKRLDSALKENKVLRQRVRRLTKKIDNMNKIVKELKENNGIIK